MKLKQSDVDYTIHIQQKVIAADRELLSRAREYLQHPDVVAIPFAINSQVLADQITKLIGENDG